MSSIITFYSYKGGVGRSMALANIAFELSKKNKKVLMVDWDLEAPGLERYFDNFEIKRSSTGLLALLIEYQNLRQPNYQDYIWTIVTNNEIPIYLLPSGRDKDTIRYSSDLENFNWKIFFEQNEGGIFLENLRNQWLNDFDYVLIDSRTGLSDASGVCTIFLPDIIVPMFTANYQSLFGIRDIMKYIQAARQKLAVDRMALTILPIPSRFGTRVEFKESQEWLDRISDILKDCFGSWLPKWIEPRYILEKIKIPQVDYFSFGEKLAVVEHGTNDPESVGYIYSQIANLFISNFEDMPAFIGHDYYNLKKQEYDYNQYNFEPENYDLFVSYPRKSYHWISNLLIPALTEYLHDELGYSPQIYVDFNELGASKSWTFNVQNAFFNAKAYMFIISEEEVVNDRIVEEEFEFLQDELLLRSDKKNNIYQILLSRPNSMLTDIKSINSKLIIGTNFLDFSAFANVEEVMNSTKLRMQFGLKIQTIASTIANDINTLSIYKESDEPLTQKFIINKKIEILCTEYETLRKQMSSGPERTIRLETVFQKMKLKANEIEIILAELSNSKSSGKRLAAIANLQVTPKLEYIPWLVSCVGDSEKPFIGYQATIGIYIAARMFRLKQKQFLLEAIDLAFLNLNGHKFIDPNQVYVLNAAKAELNFS